MGCRRTVSIVVGGMHTRSSLLSVYSPADHWWIVHFAPSSAKHVFPHLCDQFDMPMREDWERGATRRHARIAAIGPTTSTFLEEELGVRVDVVPTKPTPEALAEAIARWDEGHRL